MSFKFDKFTSTELKLYAMLTNIWDDYGFVAGTLNALETDSERDAVIEFIKNTDGITPSQITLYAFDIDQERSRNVQE